MKARRASATAAVLLQSLLTLPALSLALTTQISAEEKPIVIGLDADFTGSAPQSGMAIERGMLLAIDEINAAGGVIGRPLTLKSMDDRGVPARGVDNIDRFLEMDDLVALVGGLHSPVMLAQTRKANEEELILFSAWAAATPIGIQILTSVSIFNDQRDFSTEISDLQRANARIIVVFMQAKDAGPFLRAAYAACGLATSAAWTSVVFSAIRSNAPPGASRTRARARPSP